MRVALKGEVSLKMVESRAWVDGPTALNGPTGRLTSRYYINRIWFVCVCVYVTKDRERLHHYGHIIYQSTQNLQSSAQKFFQICPTDRPDAIGRKVDAIGKNRSKKA